jgi:hypothetical protein
MAQVLDQILEAPSQKEAQSRFSAVAAEVEENAPGAFEVLDDGLLDASAVLALPDKYRLFPNRESAHRRWSALRGNA